MSSKYLENTMDIVCSKIGSVKRTRLSTNKDYRDNNQISRKSFDHKIMFQSQKKSFDAKKCFKWKVLTILKFLIPGNELSWFWGKSG